MRYVCTELVRAGVVSGEWGETHETRTARVLPPVCHQTPLTGPAPGWGTCVLTLTLMRGGPAVLSHDIPVTTPRGVCAPRGPRRSPAPLTQDRREGRDGQNRGDALHSHAFTPAPSVLIRFTFYALTVTLTHARQSAYGSHTDTLLPLVCHCCHSTYCTSTKSLSRLSRPRAPR